LLIAKFQKIIMTNSIWKSDLSNIWCILLQRLLHCCFLFWDGCFSCV